jgi:hypothetical protein
VKAGSGPGSGDRGGPPRTASGAQVGHARAHQTGRRLISGEPDFRREAAEGNSTSNAPSSICDRGCSGLPTPGTPLNHAVAISSMPGCGQHTRRRECRIGRALASVAAQVGDGAEGVRRRTSRRPVGGDTNLRCSRRISTRTQRLCGEWCSNQRSDRWRSRAGDSQHHRET